MPDTAARTDAIDVQEIMEQIRARIREKRGSDIPDGAPPESGGRTRGFSDSSGAHAELLARLRETRPVHLPVDVPTYTFEDYTLFESHRGPLRFIRKLLAPILKLFFNPNPLIQALNTQARINTLAAEREAVREQARAAFEQVQYEVLHALVVETARLGAEMKRATMQIESLASRVEFNEKRTRAIESASVYRPAPQDRVEPSREPSREARREERREEPPPPPPMREVRDAPPAPLPAASAPQPSSQPNTAVAGNGEGAAPRGRRRRRRRGRRGGGGAQPPTAGAPTSLPGAAESDTSTTAGDPSASRLDAGDAGDDEGDWDSGDAADERGTPPDRVDPEPSDQDQ